MVRLAAATGWQLPVIARMTHRALALWLDSLPPDRPQPVYLVELR